MGRVDTGGSGALVMLSGWRNKVYADQCLHSWMGESMQYLVCVKLEFACQDGPSDVVQEVCSSHRAASSSREKSEAPALVGVVVSTDLAGCIVNDDPEIAQVVLCG